MRRSGVIALLVPLMFVLRGATGAQLPKLPGASAFAQDNLNEASSYELQGDLDLAEVFYEMAMNQKDDDEEDEAHLGLIRATAGLRWCLLAAKRQRFEKASDICRKVIQMPDAPMWARQYARQIIDKLPQPR